MSVFTSSAGRILVPDMSEREIPQIRKPGRERPYVTIVDAGVAHAALSFLSMLELWLHEARAEGDTLDDVIAQRIDWDRVRAIVNGLNRDVETRTL